MMDSIDLNFLTENEIEIIVSVIDKDFELKASEKARICRLRKKMIRNDQKAVDLSETILDGICCVICFQKFIFLINPKKVCCSCNLQICKSCCKYIAMFENFVCSICQQRKDLIAMNCTWFYENIRRRFMDGGSQIVANSLSEYPKKNLISPAILNMVKGTQITKFRHQIEEVSRTIEESLIKVELSSTDQDTKSAKYSELLQKFVEKLSQILRNTSQILYITMENYLNKTGKKNTNIDSEVLNTLHEEVELLIGRKIDISSCQRNLWNNKMSLEELHGKDSLEECLSGPIVDKLLFDLQQSLMETRGLDYDRLNSPLKTMVKKTKLDSMDFEFESISQAPSRHGTLRRSIHVASPPQTLYEAPKSASLESLHSSRLYSLNEGREKSVIVSKQWNELVSHHSLDMLDSVPAFPEVTESPIFVQDDDVLLMDSDALSMATVNADADTNWLMKARCPIGSLNSLFMESNDPCISRINRRPSISTKSEVLHGEQTIDHDVHRMYQENRTLLTNPNDISIDREYERNLPLSSSTPSLNKNQQFVESGESQDSGIVTCVNDNHGQQPLVPSRKSRILQSSLSLTEAPQIPKRKSVSITRPEIAVSRADVSSDSSVEENKSKKMIIVKARRK